MVKYFRRFLTADTLIFLSLWGLSTYLELDRPIKSFIMSRVISYHETDLLDWKTMFHHWELVDDISANVTTCTCWKCKSMRPYNTSILIMLESAISVLNESLYSVELSEKLISISSDLCDSMIEVTNYSCEQIENKIYFIKLQFSHHMKILNEALIYEKGRELSLCHAGYDELSVLEREVESEPSKI